MMIPAISYVLPKSLVASGNSQPFHQTFRAMKIDIQSIHFDADHKLLDYINRKVSKLDTFHDSIKGAEVFLKLQKAADKENKVVEIRVNVNNGPLFAEHKSVSFEAATDIAVDQLKTQVKRYNERLKEK